MATMRASAILNLPIETVWTQIRDFGSHAGWLHGTRSIEFLHGNGTTVGSVRRVWTLDGSYFDETLLSLNDETHSMSYNLIGTIPLPVFNVRGDLKLYSVTVNNTTFIERILQFDCELRGEQYKDFIASRIEQLTDGIHSLARLIGA